MAVTPWSSYDNAPAAGGGNNSSSPWNAFGESAGLGAMGAGLGQLFANYQNPADAASPYFNQISQQLPQYFQPYMQAGQGMLGPLGQQYGNLMNNPGGVMNSIGSGYQQSPGFQWQLQQGLMGANNAASAGGMLGTPQHQQQAATMATGLANQDYYNYLSRALGMYGQGLQGAQGLAGLGADASMGLGEDLSSNLAQQAGLAYKGQENENQQQGGEWGSLLGGAASMLPFLMMSSIKIKDYDSTPSTKEILDNVRELSLDKWKYKDIDQKFLGTYAEEFSNRFGVGDSKTINIIDMVGVLLGAIKELDKKIAILEGK